MTAIDWMYKNESNNKWIATDNGLNWVDKIVQRSK
jgi:hypothetical protein